MIREHQAGGSRENLCFGKEGKITNTQEITVLKKSVSNTSVIMDSSMLKLLGDRLLMAKTEYSHVL